MAHVVACGLLVALVAAAQLPLSVSAGRVAGRVVDAGTGAPIPGARVSLTTPRSTTEPWPPTRPPQGQTPPPLPSDPASMFEALRRLNSETNADGVFEIRDVPVWRWAIQVRKDGYVPLSAETMPVVDVEAGRDVFVPDVRLDRGGAIAGRVRDATGGLLSGVPVLTLSRQRLPDGAVRFLGSGASTRTNDLGEFRLSGLAPGPHYVVAHEPPRPMPVGAAPPPPAPSTYVTTFYPAVTDAAAASPVNVTRGATTYTNDLWMQLAPAYQVTGVAVDANGRPVAGAIVRLAQRNVPLGASIFGGPTASDGRFRLVNVPPGTYTLMATVPVVTRNASGGTSSSFGFGEAAEPGAAPEVTVQGADLADLRVVVREQ